MALKFVQPPCGWVSILYGLFFLELPCSLTEPQLGGFGRSGTNDAYLCPLCCLSYMLLVNMMSMMLQYLSGHTEQQRPKHPVYA